MDFHFRYRGFVIVILHACPQHFAYTPLLELYQCFTVLSPESHYNPNGKQLEQFHLGLRCHRRIFRLGWPTLHV